MNVSLLVIDPQVDFCDPSGALFVKGADQDMARLAAMLRLLGGRVGEVHVTLDDHPLIHVSHPCYWVGKSNTRPDPFTKITPRDVEDGVWTTSDPLLRERALSYLRAFEKGGRYPLVVWPPHCLTGSPGQCVVKGLLFELDAWQYRTGKPVSFWRKGANPHVEQYSAIRAEVPDPDDKVNDGLVDAMGKPDLILVAGEAGSHCLANSVRDLVDEAPKLAMRIAIIEDATSPVPGFEETQAKFIREMKDKGVVMTTTEKVVSTLT